MTSLTLPTPEAFSAAVKDKVIIITGAASGIGFATAHLFANSGARVVIADLDEDAGTQAATDIEHNCAFVKCDVSSWKEQLHLFTTTQSIYGRIDFVVCNAGLNPEIKVAGSSKDKAVMEAKNKVKSNFLADEVDEGSDGLLKCPSTVVMDINVSGAIYGIKLATHHMSKTGGGRVIVMGSAASYVAVPEQAIYCASKHAVLGLVRATSARADLKENSISISMVAPWLTSTTMTRNLDFGKDVLVSTSSDVGWAVAYLATMPREKVNGKSIWVQGQSYTEVEDFISDCHGKLIKRWSDGGE
ncbi:NAD(P)-binding protein [Cadophora sp. DSE1049]|nr:NAD(P)-binding protein [Cadophora sp. DSE1049]